MDDNGQPTDPNEDEIKFIFGFLDSGIGSLIETRQPTDNAKIGATGMLFAKTLALSRVHRERDPGTITDTAFVEGDEGAALFLEEAIIALKNSYRNFIALARAATDPSKGEQRP